MFCCVMHYGNISISWLKNNDIFYKHPNSCYGLKIITTKQVQPTRTWRTAASVASSFSPDLQKRK